METKHKKTDSMKRISKYLRTAAMTVLLPAFACNETVPETMQPAYIMESVSIEMEDNLRAKLYTDETGTLALPLLIGETAELGYSCTPSPDEITFPQILWSSSNEDVIKIDENGVITALSEGYAIVSISPATTNTIATDAIKVNVVASVTNVTSISISDDSEFNDETYGLPACYTGETMTLTATVTPDDATYKTVLWSSLDEEIATVDPISGVVTGLSKGKATIKATALDAGQVSATHEIFIDQIINPVGIKITNIPSASDIFSISEGSFTADYETYPSVSTKSMIQWTVSDDVVASVDKGTVTFKLYGSVTVTATCPDADGQIPAGYAKSVSFTVNIPAGYYNETSDTGDGIKWSIKKDDLNKGAKIEYTEGATENYWLITPYAQNSTKARGDIQHSSPTYIHSDYPVICFRIDDLGDAGYSRNINLDTSGDFGGTKYSGNVGGSNNKWNTKYKCSDGSAILVYDLSIQGFATGGAIPAGVTGTFSTFQIKYADIATVTDPTSVPYRFFWFKTFKSQEAMLAFLEEWSVETGITYSK